jgi:hypothetical protein
MITINIEKESQGVRLPKAVRQSAQTVKNKSGLGLFKTGIIIAETGYKLMDDKHRKVAQKWAKNR